MKTAHMFPQKLACVLVAGMLINIHAADWYWNGNVSTSWSNPNNFQSSGLNLPGLPQPGDNVSLEPWASQPPVINNGGNAALNAIFVSRDMTIAAGGALDTTYFKLGPASSPTLTVSGGSLAAGNHLDIGGYGGGTATMNVYGGAVTVGGLYLNLNGATTGASYLSLFGGTITDTGPLSINSSHPAVIDIRGGTLKVPQSQLGNVNYWLGSQNILGNGLANNVYVDQISNPGYLVLTAVPEPASLTLVLFASILGLLTRRSR